VADRCVPQRIGVREHPHDDDTVKRTASAITVGSEFKIAVETLFVRLDSRHLLLAGGANRQFASEGAGLLETPDRPPDSVDQERRKPSNVTAHRARLTLPQDHVGLSVSGSAE
jgi:hypothetical protein